jgi:hypothetical protein
MTTEYVLNHTFFRQTNCGLQITTSSYAGVQYGVNEDPQERYT